MAKKPVVFVPGFPASTLRDANGELFPPTAAIALPAKRRKWLDAILAADDPADTRGISPGTPIRHSATFCDHRFALGRQAQTLYDVLAEMGYDVTGASNDFRPVGWDWRLRVDHPATHAAVTRAIDDLHAIHGGGVAVVVHSTGGLVLRSLLDLQPQVATRIAHVIALGVPWAGTLKSLRYASAQEGFGPVTRSEMAEFISSTHAAFDLMPPDPQTSPEANLGFVTDGAGNPASPLTDTSWIPAGPRRAGLLARAASSAARLGNRTRTLGANVPVTLIAGYGLATDTRCKIANGTVTFDDPPGDEGDGTVPLWSAAFLLGAGVRRYLVPAGFYAASHDGDHPQLFESPPVKTVLKRILLGRKPSIPHLHAAFDTVAVSNRLRSAKVRLIACDTEGRPLPDVEASFDQGFQQNLGLAAWDKHGRGTLTWHRPPGAQGAAVKTALTFRRKGTGEVLRRFDFLIPN